MNILYDKAPTSVIKAVLLSKLKGGRPVYKANAERGVDVSLIDYDILLNAYEQTFGKVSWLRNNQNSFGIFYRMIKRNLRAKQPDKFDLTVKAIEQALVYGSEIFFRKPTPEAKTFCLRARPT